MSDYTLELTQNGNIGRINFGHPAKNAMTLEMLNELASTIDKANESGISVLILASTGDSVFCAGANFDQLLALQNQSEATDFFSGFARVILAIRRSKALVIGRIQAKAVGGGVGLIAACDYCFATEKSSVKLSEIGIGIAPLVIEPAVTRKIGVGAMAEFSLSPTSWHSADWARKNNLYQSVHNSISELDSALNEKASQLSLLSPDALFALKASLWQGTAHFETLLFERAAASGALALTPSARAILTAFKNRKNA
jgi:methylglutaconyl-CoA hydratase